MLIDLRVTDLGQVVTIILLDKDCNYSNLHLVKVQPCWKQLINLTLPALLQARN